MRHPLPPTFSPRPTSSDAPPSHPTPASIWLQIRREAFLLPSHAWPRRATLLPSSSSDTYSLCPPPSLLRPPAPHVGRPPDPGHGAPPHPPATPFTRSKPQRTPAPPGDALRRIQAAAHPPATPYAGSRTRRTPPPTPPPGSARAAAAYRRRDDYDGMGGTLPHNSAPVRSEMPQPSLHRPRHGSNESIITTTPRPSPAKSTPGRPAGRQGCPGQRPPALL
ncbi:formin-like protein 20 [Triticum aestivum]|uniref:formin-like protein 20 n=1 Tax=Triticum aestivum TaxID=4565 RepID=UPI001D02789E|nr:formin-like protein 20 [Triticum aestivum]